MVIIFNLKNLLQPARVKVVTRILSQGFRWRAGAPSIISECVVIRNKTLTHDNWEGVQSLINGTICKVFIFPGQEDKAFEYLRGGHSSSDPLKVLLDGSGSMYGLETAARLWMLRRYCVEKSISRVWLVQKSVSGGVQFDSVIRPSDLTDSFIRDRTRACMTGGGTNLREGLEHFSERGVSTGDVVVLTDGEDPEWLRVDLI